MERPRPLKADPGFVERPASLERPRPGQRVTMVKARGRPADRTAGFATIPVVPYSGAWERRRATASSRPLSLHRSALTVRRMSWWYDEDGNRRPWWYIPVVLLALVLGFVFGPALRRWAGLP